MESNVQDNKEVTTNGAMVLDMPEVDVKPVIEKTNDAVVTDMETVRKDMGLSVEEFYAIPRDPPSESKLPMFDAAHVRNALARFNQVKGVTPEEKKTAFNKLKEAAKKFDINVTKQQGTMVDMTNKMQSMCEEIKTLISSDKKDEALAKIDEMMSYCDSIDMAPEEDMADTEMAHKKKATTQTAMQDLQKQLLDEIDMLKKTIFEQKGKLDLSEKEKSTFQSNEFKVTELISMNEKLVVSLKESDSKVTILEKGIDSLKQELGAKQKVISLFEEEQKAESDKIRNEKVDKVASMYTRHFNIPETEQAEIKNMVSNYSEDMLEKTAKHLEMKESSSKKEVPVQVTQPSDALRNHVSAPVVEKRKVQNDEGFVMRNYVGFKN